MLRTAEAGCCCLRSLLDATLEGKIDAEAKLPQGTCLSRRQPNLNWECMTESGAPW
jgi:hypothetical protein